MQKHFKPAWWLANPHLQTLWPALFRRKKQLAMQLERFELTDGDFLDLAWVGSGTGPLVLVLHGLNGGVNSHYANGILHAITKRGWRGVLMHFRGCSGEPNRLARSYHSGETGDLNAVIAELKRREPDTLLFVLGYSLGGNILLKALGEGLLQQTINAAAAVSIPFELAKTANKMSLGFSKFYQWHLVRGLTAAYKRKFGAVAKLKTFWEFDDAVTAPLHGFKNASDYYQQSSSRSYLKNIQIPTLIIHSRDDPFTTLSAIPQPHDISDKVELELTEHGGHVGFVSGKYPWQPIYWLELRILNFFSTYTITTEK